MSYCARIQSIVDEADKADVIPLEAASHLSGCPECRGFADERAKLQELMASSARVTVPVNFNALLNEKLSQVKAQKSSWLNSVGLVRLGTATAGLAIILIAVQYSGLFSSKPNNNVGQVPSSTEIKPPDAPPPLVDPKDKEATQMAAAEANGRPVGTGGGGASRASARTQRDSQRNGITILIVRDRDREVEVPMISVSLGMQQQVLNSSGRQQPRSSDISY